MEKVWENFRVSAEGRRWNYVPQFLAGSKGKTATSKKTKSWMRGGLARKEKNKINSA